MTETYEKIKWPNNARCAVMLSFDLDGNTIWANGNRSYPGGENFIRSISIGDYGPKRAVPRILDLLAKYALPATFFTPAKIVEENPALLKQIDQAGHEIGHHGYQHERFVDLTRDEQKAIILRSQDIFQQIIGKKARGYRTPSGDWSRETAGLLHELGFLYSSSMRGDDRPYRTVIDGQVTDFIEMAPKWDLDDFVQFGYNLFPAEPAGQDRISGIEQVYNNFKQEFDGYYQYGLCFVLLMHPQIIGKPGRLLMLEQLLQHMKSHQDIWFATGEEIAEWWRANY
ncbi:polysaccharide deacetylase family protein [Desulforamulus aeronauticus]|uniref:Peptidoglycan/xylan/chitin deacetylase, PgdA/CDA1 family n=1 Tax=Desulforamulus aeronauticus DSM 10349 TaxID=1121421 RepID=A0A1M6TUU5_9FIRM|nr:polysaccharide deacetylase [Desulforamulus aeronauticus]SHK60772.1 Peptidoglycan/xylan/chitin deacetylase, PgdA/CDA1 family [Desulforamulus aeronauticus DSM 10349]